MANLTAALSVISETCAIHKFVFSKLVYNFIDNKIKALCMSSRPNVLDKMKNKTAITLTPPTVGRQSADKMPDFSSFFIGRQKINYN